MKITKKTIEFKSAKFNEFQLVMQLDASALIVLDEALKRFAKEERSPVARELVDGLKEAWNTANIKVNG